jgi:hypothetical protein
MSNRIEINLDKLFIKLFDWYWSTHGYCTFELGQFYKKITNDEFEYLILLNIDKYSIVGHHLRNLSPSKIKIFFHTCVNSRHFKTLVDHWKDNKKYFETDPIRFVFYQYALNYPDELKDFLAYLWDAESFKFMREIKQVQRDRIKKCQFVMRELDTICFGHVLYWDKNIICSIISDYIAFDQVF